MIKEFVIFKNSKQDNPKAPTHRVMARVDQDLVEVGAGWARESKTGNKFLSIKLKDPYQDKKGFYLEIEGNNTPPEGQNTPVDEF